MPKPASTLAIIGPGRAGLALGQALLEAGAVSRLLLVGRSRVPPEHPLFRRRSPDVSYRRGMESTIDPPPEAFIIAVPDGEIAAVAGELAARPLPRTLPVLHLSGAFGSELLSAMADRGHPTGSLHPLVALSDAEAASRLRGAWFACEGAPAALALAHRLVASLDGRILAVAGDGKPLYHAAAVAASNFVVALVAVAERWMAGAGVPPEAARRALGELAAGAVENAVRLGPAEGLTGPVARGDAGTVAAHLGRLSSDDRHLYSVLARSALTLARQRGLDSAAADELARLLETIE